MRLPDAAALGLGKHQTSVAVKVAEVLLGVAVEDRPTSQEAYLGGTGIKAVLDHFPVREVRVAGEPPRGGQAGFWAYPYVGMVGPGPRIHPASYRVDARVGYEPDGVPALVCRLVEMLARWEPGDEEAAEEALQVAEAGYLVLVQPAEVARKTYRE